MKCTNCGFECDSNFCPMCGAKTIENQPLQQQPVNSGVQMPVQQPPITNQQMQKPTQPQGFPSMQPPVQPIKVIKKNSNNKKALTIVFSCLIAVVIAAGTAINIVSACNGQNTILENISKSLQSYSDSNYDDYDYSEYGNYDDNLSIYDDKTYTLGEKAKVSDGTIALTKIEKTDISSNTYKDLNVYNISFEITNSSDKTAYYTNQDILASPTTSWVDDTYYNYNSISDDIEYNDNDELEIEAGKSKTITLLYSLPTEATTVNINFMCDRNFYKNSSVTSGSYDLHFSADIPK